MELDVFLVDNKKENVCDCKIIRNSDTKSCTIYGHDSSTALAEVTYQSLLFSLILSNFYVTMNEIESFAFVGRLENSCWYQSVLCWVIENMLIGKRT